MFLAVVGVQAKTATTAASVEAVTVYLRLLREPQ
jgi:hypothetical protein